MKEAMETPYATVLEEDKHSTARFARTDCYA